MKKEETRKKFFRLRIKGHSYAQCKKLLKTLLNYEISIRTAIHSPATTGKIERSFQTFANELPFCKKNLNQFRMRYNHLRPHFSLKAQTDIYFAFDKLF